MGNPKKKAKRAAKWLAKANNFIEDFGLNLHSTIPPGTTLNKALFNVLLRKVFKKLPSKLQTVLNKNFEKFSAELWTKYNNSQTPSRLNALLCDEDFTKAVAALKDGLRGDKRAAAIALAPTALRNHPVRQRLVKYTPFLREYQRSPEEVVRFLESYENKPEPSWPFKASSLSGLAHVRWNRFPAVSNETEVRYMQLMRQNLLKELETKHRSPGFSVDKFAAKTLVMLQTEGSLASTIEFLSDMLKSPTDVVVKCSLFKLIFRRMWTLTDLDVQSDQDLLLSLRLIREAASSEVLSEEKVRRLAYLADKCWHTIPKWLCDLCKNHHTACHSFSQICFSKLSKEQMLTALEEHKMGYTVQKQGLTPSDGETKSENEHEDSESESSRDSESEQFFVDVGRGSFHQAVGAGDEQKVEEPKTPGKEIGIEEDASETQMLTFDDVEVVQASDESAGKDEDDQMEAMGGKVEQTSTQSTAIFNEDDFVEDRDGAEEPTVDAKRVDSLVHGISQSEPQKTENVSDEDDVLFVLDTKGDQLDEELPMELEQSGTTKRTMEHLDATGLYAKRTKYTQE